MKLTIIGCTGSMSGPKSAASCYLVQARGYDPAIGADREWNIVLDMGPGSFGDLWRHINPSDIDAVLFSHCHADHMGDVISYHVFQRWGPGRGSAPVLLAGSCDLLDRVRQIDGVGVEESYEDCFTFHRFEEEPVFSVGPVEIRSALGVHSIPSYAVRLTASREDGSEASVVYTGDTDFCQSVVELSRGVDVLLSECGFTQADTVEGIHMDGCDVGRLATEAGVGRLLVTHIQPWTDHDIVRAEISQEWSEPVHIVQADDVFDI